MRNLSTFEIDCGPAVFEIQEAGDEETGRQWRTIARLKGDFFTRRGEFHVPFEVETVSLDDDETTIGDHAAAASAAAEGGEVNGESGPSGISPAAKKLGLDVEKTYYFQGIRTEMEGAWTNDAIKFIRSPMLLTDKFISLY